MLIWIAAILLALAIFGIGGGAILILHPGQTRVGTRVRRFVTLGTPPEPRVMAREQGRRRADLFQQLDARWERRPRARLQATEIERAGLGLSVTELALLRAGSAVLLAVLAILLVPGWWLLLLVPALLLGAWLPLVYVRFRARGRLRRLDQQLPDILSLLAGTVRSGTSLFQAIDRVAHEAPEPSRTEYLRVVRTISLGAPLDTALRGLADRMPTEDMDMLTTAISIQQQTGGNIAQILDLIAGTVRERQRIQREINVLNSQQRLSAYMLAALPIFLTLVLFLINPHYIGRVFEPGWVLLLPCTVVVLLVLGFIVMSRIAHIDV